MEKWKTLCKDSLVDTPWLKVDKETCKLPNGKIINDFYTLWQPDWVLILAKNENGQWIMTRQYRHGNESIALEFPAGIIDKNETPEKAAIRELQEECGFAATTTTYLGAFPVNPDRHRGRFHVVYVECAKKQGSTHFDETENIEYETLSDQDLQKKIVLGEINHPLQIAGYFKWKLNYGK